MWSEYQWLDRGRLKGGLRPGGTVSYKAFNEAMLPIDSGMGPVSAFAFNVLHRRGQRRMRGGKKPSRFVRVGRYGGCLVGQVARTGWSVV